MASHQIHVLQEYHTMNIRNNRFQKFSRKIHAEKKQEYLIPVRITGFFVLVFTGIFLSGFGHADIVSTASPPGMNLSIDPGEDFFSYANYYWVQDHPVPPENTFYTAFEEVKDTVDTRVRELVEDASLDYGAEDGTPRQLLGSFYRAAMNDRLNAEVGLKPVQDDLEEIERAQNRAEVRRVASNLTARGLDPFFILYIDENPQKRKELIAVIETGDFTIRFPPYYELEFDEAKRVQNEMKKYIISTCTNQGMDSNAAINAADKIFRIERRLARAEMLLNTSHSSSPQNLSEGTYNVSDLNTLFPGTNWEALFERSGRPDLKEVYVMNPHYLQEVGRILSTEPVDDLKLYLTWRVLQFASPFASPEMQEAYYQFYDEKLSKKEITPQKDRVFDILNLYLGNPIAHLYVDKYFSSSDKAKAEDIIKNIREVMRERVLNLSWMSQETKDTALLKMSYLKEQAGYPEDWGEYQNLTIKDQSYLENMLALTEYFTNGSLQLPGEPSDPDVWYVSPHGVEAHYDLVHNRIVVPAGFLNPPFFDPLVDDAWNYGSFGWVYGHELTHMIDIGGQQYSPDGKKENWWTDDDANQYFHAAWPLIVQVNSTKVLDNLTLNVTQMLIESSAVLGGLTLAYDAYIRSRPNPDTLDTPGYDGLTDRQRFFVAFAQAQRGNITDDNLRNITQTEDHPWNKFRVNMIPYHLEAFYTAFPDINQGDSLYLNESERAHLW